MISTLALIKSNLIKQLRSYQFFIIIAIGIAIAFICVPAPTADYEIFLLGGVRGIYNSAYLGAMASAVSVIILWLPGFYMLRSQISEDKRLKIGQIIASKPMSKLRYVSGKALSNFVILTVMELVFIVAMTTMQFIRGESMTLNIIGYLSPFFVITVPYLAVLAALTVFFDVIPFLKGVFGNIVIFLVWVTVSAVSLEAPDVPVLDLFGIDKIMGELMNSAVIQFPQINPNSYGIGFNTAIGILPTFEWDGFVWDSGYILTRFIWIGIAAVLVILSAIIFGRFRGSEKIRLPIIPRRSSPCLESPQTKGFETAFNIAVVQKINGINIPRLVKGELKIMSAGQPLWWYAAVIAGIGFSATATLNDGYKWYCVFMLLMIPVWSQLGCRERYHFTRELVSYRCPMRYKWIASWISGVLLTWVVSAGFLFRFISLGEWSHCSAWLIGTLFIPSLALTLGTLSENRKLFEGIFIAWFYFGSIQNVPGCDFLGIQENNSIFYLVATLILILTGLMVVVLKEIHILTYTK